MKLKTKHYLGLVIVLIVAFYGFKFATKPAYTLEPGERPYKGRADATIIVEEFSDFQCPACRSAVPYVKSLDEKYGANIRINYRHFPLRQIHQQAFDAAVASECAVDQGKFWEMHDFIFAYQGSGLSKANLRKAAEDAELDLNHYDACITNKAGADIVRADERVAAELRLSSTPSFTLNGVPLQDRSQLEPMIRQLLGLPAEEL